MAINFGSSGTVVSLFGCFRSFTTIFTMTAVEYAGIAVVLGIWLLLRSGDKSRLLPGPPGIPLRGNAHQLGSNPHRQLQPWTAQFGNLFTVCLGWGNWVFANSPFDVREIFDKQSAVTSGRTPAPVLSGILSGDNRLLFVTYGDIWGKLRTVEHKSLTPGASDTYKPGQEVRPRSSYMILHPTTKRRRVSTCMCDDTQRRSFFEHIWPSSTFVGEQVLPNSRPHVPNVLTVTTLTVTTFSLGLC